MNLRPPPTTDDIEDLRKWCEEVYEFLKFPHFHGINLVPRASMADTTEGNVYYDSDTDKLTLRVAAAWEPVTRIGVWVDADAADQGATNNTNSIKSILNLYGTSNRINLYFEHRQGDANQTEYKVDTSIDFSSYPNVYFYFMPGAYVDGVTGDETFKPYSPENIDAGPRQQVFGSSLTVAFSVSGEYPFHWFPVTGDGTTNDQAAMQQAIDAAPSGANITKILGFPDSTYSINSGLSWSGKTIEIDLQDGTIQAGAAFGVMLSITSANGKLILRNATLDGNANLTGDIISVTSSAVMPEIYDSTLDDAGSDGVWTDNTSTGTFIAERTTSQNNTHHGFKIWGAAGAIARLINCNGLSNGSMGAIIEVDGGEEIIGGRWYNNSSGGVSLRDNNGGSTPGYFMRVVGAQFEDNSGAQIYLGLGGRNASITGNVLKDPSNNGYGIALDTIDNSDVGQPAYVSVTGNSIEGATRAIRINGTKYFNITGNEIYNPSTNAIHILNDSNYGLVSGNHCYGTNASMIVSGATGSPDYHCEYIAFKANQFHGVSDPSAGSEGYINIAADQKYIDADEGQYVKEASTNVTLHALPMRTIEYDTSGGNRTLTLPDVGSNDISLGQVVTVILIDATNQVTVQRAGSDNFFNADGTTTTSDVFTNKGDGATYISVTGGWIRTQLSTI